MDLIKETEKRLANAKAVHQQTNCFITIMNEHAMNRAKEIENKIASGSMPGSLYGLFFSIKDNINIKGIPSSAGSNILKGFTPSESAWIVKKIEEADGIIIGKTNLDEFGMGGTGETSAFGPTYIYNKVTGNKFSPGGSSSGAPLTVKRKAVDVAIGTDTGGSVRQPAAFSRLIGFKPTYGTVSRNGLIAYGSSLDQIGIITDNKENIIKTLSAISAKDPGDTTQMNCSNLHTHSPDYIYSQFERISNRKLNQFGNRLKFAYPKQFRNSAIDPDVNKSIEDGIIERELDVEEIDLPILDMAIPTYYIIAMAEASSNLSRYDGVRYGSRKESDNLHAMYERTRADGFGKETLRRIILGTFVLSEGYNDAYYKKAMAIREDMKKHIGKVFEKYDLIICPTVARKAFQIGEITDPLAAYAEDVYTTVANLAGLPSLTISHQEEYGMQIIGKPFDEYKLLHFSNY